MVLVHVFSRAQVMVPDDCMSERISVSRDCIAGAIDPHRLTALAGGVVRHAGRALGRCRDFTAFDSVRLCPFPTLVDSFLGRRWRRQ